MKGGVVFGFLEEEEAEVWGPGLASHDLELRWQDPATDSSLPFPFPGCCALLDLDFRRGSGLWTLRSMRALVEAELPLVILAHGATVSHAVHAMKLGAHDFIPAPIEPDTLVRALLEAVTASRDQARAALERRRARELLSRLSPREQQVLDHVTAGRSSQEIADILGLSKRTVDAHRSHLMEKLEASSVVEVVRTFLCGVPSRAGATRGGMKGDHAESAIASRTAGKPGSVRPA